MLCASSDGNKSGRVRAFRHRCGHIKLVRTKKKKLRDGGHQAHKLVKLLPTSSSQSPTPKEWLFGNHLEPLVQVGKSNMSQTNTRVGDKTPTSEITVRFFGGSSCIQSSIRRVACAEWLLAPRPC